MCQGYDYPLKIVPPATEIRYEEKTTLPPVSNVMMTNGMMAYGFTLLLVKTDWANRLKFYGEL